MINRFCKEVLEFLKSEYNDAYEFNLELTETMDERRIELKIKSGGYTRIITNDYMRYFYERYLEKKYLYERNQFKWQKELIDLIEGC